MCIRDSIRRGWPGRGSGRGSGGCCGFGARNQLNLGQAVSGLGGSRAGLSGFPGFCCGTGGFGLSHFTGGVSAHRFAAGGFGLRRFLGSIRLSRSPSSLSPSGFGQSSFGSTAIFGLRGLGFGLISSRVRRIQRTGSGLGGFQSPGFRPGSSAAHCLGTGAFFSRFSLCCTVKMCIRDRPPCTPCRFRSRGPRTPADGCHADHGTPPVRSQR